MNTMNQSPHLNPVTLCRIFNFCVNKLHKNARYCHICQFGPVLGPLAYTVGIAAQNRARSVTTDLRLFKSEKSNQRIGVEVCCKVVCRYRPELQHDRVNARISADEIWSFGRKCHKFTASWLSVFAVFCFFNTKNDFKMSVC